MMRPHASSSKTATAAAAIAAAGESLATLTMAGVAGRWWAGRPLSLNLPRYRRGNTKCGLSEEERRR